MSENDVAASDDGYPWVPDRDQCADALHVAINCTDAELWARLSRLAFARGVPLGRQVAQCVLAGLDQIEGSLRKHQQ